MVFTLSTEIPAADPLFDALLPADALHVARALERAQTLYGARRLGTGEAALDHALGVSRRIAQLKLDGDTRCAALLFAAFDDLPAAHEQLNAEFGAAVARLVLGLYRLGQLRPLTRAASVARSDMGQQAETLRKMLLAMADDVRVVLLRLASRAQTLNWFAAQSDSAERLATARESLEIYAPLANRLGVWQLKWEIEDLAFRFLEPATYQRIARLLEEKRSAREAFITAAKARLESELDKVGIKSAEVSGRPKHIYSIHNKMRGKNIEFAEVYDVRALRIIVPEVRDCYTALGLVHALWLPIHGEFDDYISHPKGNDYRSLHTAVTVEDGGALEVQIRTFEMHRHAELGIAAHWRYKEKSASDAAYDDKIAWLRQLLSWRDEVADSAAWVEEFKRAALDDTLYVLTPQGRVIDLPKGATPLDFAYRVHTDLGHRCRGAKVDGHLVPLETKLASGQTVEIVAAKSGGPSRDWLNPGYLTSARARQKVKAWFAEQQRAAQIEAGRAWVLRELQREGKKETNLDELAKKLGQANANGLFLAAAQNQVGPQALRLALTEAPPATAAPIVAKQSRAAASGNGIRIEGVSNLLTQLARCCKPLPPDALAGFVTRGRGVSVHRADCANFRQMSALNPQRVVAAAWGDAAGGLFASVIHVEASDRQGLLRDISEVLAKEKINVTSVQTKSAHSLAHMVFSVELANLAALRQVLARLKEVPGVASVRRG